MKQQLFINIFTNFEPDAWDSQAQATRQYNKEGENRTACWHIEFPEGSEPTFKKLSI